MNDVILKDGKFHFLLSESNQKYNAVDIDEAVDLTVKMIELLQEENKKKHIMKE